MLSSTLKLIKNRYLGWFLHIRHKVSGDMDVLGKAGLHIRNQQEKSYQNDELFFLEYEKVLRMQTRVFLMI